MNKNSWDWRTFGQFEAYFPTVHGTIMAFLWKTYHNGRNVERHGLEIMKAAGITSKDKIDDQIKDAQGKTKAAA